MSPGSPERRRDGRRRSNQRGRATAPWEGLPDSELLDWRLCDLGLEIPGTPLEDHYHRLLGELERRGLRFRPYVWLSTDWFTPDGATGFAIPFYLAHPRLRRLEQRNMFEVEGGTTDWCMRIMRHETAHAIDNAYRLHWKKSWRETFGRFSQKYDNVYSPDPNSRHFVQNLPYWYAQSHPAEDWAETFAVWLQPGARWRKRYESWPALRKLEYVEELMAQIAEAPVVLRSRFRDEPLRSVKMTLREYYDRKKAIYEDEALPAFDGQLLRLFDNGDTPRERGEAPTAVGFLRKHRRRIVQHVSTVTGQNAYLVDHVVSEITRRSKSKRLWLAADEAETLVDVCVLVTALSMHFLHGSHPRYHR